jgi:TolB-like protein/DNA-binding winged helix-turn-helix (wHTH) protein/Tfp pilus assembly protein PilF
VETDRAREIDGSAARSAVSGTFRVGAWTVDPAGNRIRQRGQEVRLEPKVMRVLVLLAENGGEVVTRRDLEDKVWPRMLVSDDAVTNTLIKLRKALGDDARDPRYVETIAKSGYRLIAEVAPLEAGAPPPGEAVTPATAARAAHRLPRLNTAAVAVGLLAGLAIAVWVLFELGRGDAERSAVGAQRPVLAVLPLANLNADPEQDYFADGITEDLITDLSKLSGLQVVARNAVFAYRGSTEPEAAIGEELGARFLVKGSVQRAGERLRINIRLVDAAAGRNRWAERYERDIADIFRVQDEIAARVATSLQVELAPGERQRLTRGYATSVEAYDEYLRGLDLLGRRASADNPEARAHFERAIALEPGFARAHAGLAMTYALHASYGTGAPVRQLLDRAEAIARRGLAIDDSQPQLRYALGLVAMYRGELKEAVDEVSRAIELRPSYADAYGLLAWILHFAGRPDEGLEAMRRAVALNPRPSALYRTVQAALHYEQGDLEPALRLLRESVEISPTQLLTRLYLAAVYAATGQDEAAHWEVEELRALAPGFVLDLDHGFPIRDPTYRQRFLADLRRAGLGAP